MIANPESPLRKSLDANMSAAQQAAMQQALLDEYKAQTARISATRAPSPSIDISSLINQDALSRAGE
jgi:hypothetical protein